MVNKTKEEILAIIEEYEARLKLSGPIEVRVNIPLEKDSIKSLLKDILLRNNLTSHYCYEYDTDNLNLGKCISNHKNIVAFNDKNGVVQCRVGAYRSITDLYRMCLSEIGQEVKLVDVMQAVFEIINTTEPAFIHKIYMGKTYTGDDVWKDYYYYLYTGSCSTINRRRFTFTSWTPTSQGVYNYNRYGFSKSNGDYNTTAEQNHQEFPILIQDYITLFEKVEEVIDSELVVEEPKINLAEVV